MNNKEQYKDKCSDCAFKKDFLSEQDGVCAICGVRKMIK